jgi:hypothetical protein
MVMIVDLGGDTCHWIRVDVGACEPQSRERKILLQKDPRMIRKTRDKWRVSFKGRVLFFAPRFILLLSTI